MSDIAGGDWAIEDWARRVAKVSGVLPELCASGMRVVRARPLLVTALLLIGIGALAAVTLEAPPPAIPAPIPMPVRPVSSVAAKYASERTTPVWTDIVKPVEIFDLEAADLPKDPRTYAARRNSSGGRRDVIGLGTFVGEEPAMRLALYRPGTEQKVVTPIFADLARLAAEAGLAITRSGLPDLINTRFGAFEVVTLGLAKGSTTQSCSGFKLALDAPAFSITGLACGGEKVLTRARLACLLDRIDLTVGGGDRSLVDFFAASELRRDKACAGMRLGPDAVRVPVATDRPATPLKNRRRH